MHLPMFSSEGYNGYDEALGQSQVELLIRI